PDPRRLAAYLAGHVHVLGRPEWVFVKLHTHAMQNRAAFLGPRAGELYAAMEHWWNRPPFRLHYVTAREAYNIAKAAEAGYSGNPTDYRDPVLPPPANRLVHSDRAWRLHSWTARRVHLEIVEPGPVRLEFAQGPLQRVSGRLRELEGHFEKGDVVHLRL